MENESYKNSIDEINRQVLEESLLVVRMNPGITVNRLASITSFKWATAMRHLSKLERAGKVVKKRLGRSWSFRAVEE